MQLRTHVSLAAGALIAASSCATASVVFSDQDFESSAWSTQVFEINDGGGGGLTQPNGGNPGFFREHAVTLSNAPTGERSIARVVSMRDDAVYDPSVSGEVSSIRWSEDHTFISGDTFSGAGVQVGVALIQSGDLYFTPFSVPQNPDGWATHEQEFTAQDFVRFDPGNLLTGADETSMPDFSQTGEAFQIGLFRANATSPGGDARQFTYGADNWTVEIIPAPSSAALLAICGCGTTLLRRRQ